MCRMRCVGGTMARLILSNISAELQVKKITGAYRIEKKAPALPKNAHARRPRGRRPGHKNQRTQPKSEASASDGSGQALLLFIKL